MSATGYNIKQYSQGTQPPSPELKSGQANAQRVGTEQNSNVTLPQSNGVNITIINPTTNVGGTAGANGKNTTTLVASQPDSFTKTANPAEALPNNEAPVSMVPPGVSVSSSDGRIPAQTLSPTPAANTPAVALNGGGMPTNPQEHLLQDYKNLDNQYQNLQKAEQDYADAQKRYQDLGDNVNTLAYQQNTGTPASNMPNATAVNTLTAAGGNPFIFPILPDRNGAMHVVNPSNSGFPPNYSPYATYNALSPLPNSGGGNPASPAGVFMNPADPPKSSYMPSTMSYASNNPPPAGTPVPNPANGTFATVAPPPPPSLAPQAPPLQISATPPAQQVIITPTMTIPAPPTTAYPVQPFPQTPEQQAVGQQKQPVAFEPNLAYQSPAEAVPSQPQQVGSTEEASSSQLINTEEQQPAPYQQLALPPSQQQPVDLPAYFPAEQPNMAEQQVLDNQLNSVLGNQQQAQQPEQPVFTTTPNYENEAPFYSQPNAQPQQGENDNPYPTNFENTSTNSPSGGFVPSTVNVPVSSALPAEIPVGTSLTENDGSFNSENEGDMYRIAQPFSSNTTLPQNDVTAYYPNNHSNDGGSITTMGLQLPPAYNQQLPPMQRTPQGQRPMGSPPPPQAQQQQSFNATQVTPQDVAFFKEVLKMNPETAQVAGALPDPQIAQLLSGDKELLGTVRQIEGMLPPGTPPSALAAMMPPPPQGGSAPNRPMMPPPQQPQLGMPPQQQPPQRPMMPPQQQPNYGYAPPQGR